MSIDMWYGDDVKAADGITVYFNDLECTYSGNIYRDGEAIGDFTADNSVEIEKRFKGLFEWI